MASPRRFWLLPPTRYLGRTPYAWLTYLPISVIGPIAREPGWP